MQLEIVGTDGTVHYTRPHDHPDVWEALNTPGYSVRGIGEKQASGSLQPDGCAALMGIIAICEEYQNTDFEGMDDDQRADAGYNCSMAVIRMATAAILEYMAQHNGQAHARRDNEKDSR